MFSDRGPAGDEDSEKERTLASGARRTRDGGRGEGTGRTNGRGIAAARVAGFLLYFVALWWLWDTPVATPLKIFVVLLHEISHGIAAVATGGTIERIVISPDQGGACYCAGGNALVTLTAGYLGSLAWGAVFLGLARRLSTGARWATGLVGAAVLALGLLYLRNPFGFAFALLAGAALLAAARFAGPAVNQAVLAVLGLTSCLYAILDIKSDVLDRPDLPSDARMLAELTGVPTLVWGILWIGLAIAVSWMLARRWLRAP